MSPEEYLSTSFDGLDREYVHGEIRERGTPDESHSRAQAHFIGLFYDLAKERAVHVRPSLRLQLAPGEFRIPDVCVYAGEPPSEDVPSTPPLIVIEVLSSDDCFTDSMQKLGGFWMWGVRHVWLANPYAGKFSVYDSSGFREVQSPTVPVLALELVPEQIF